MGQLKSGIRDKDGRDTSLKGAIPCQVSGGHSRSWLLKSDCCQRACTGPSFAGGAVPPGKGTEPVVVLTACFN